MEYILILGVGRSGTTLLASMLGGHPDISMLDEGDDIDKLVGTKYAGMKYPTSGGQIMYSRRSLPIIGAIVNRIINFGTRKQKWRLFPLCKYSIKQLINKGCTVIISKRNKGDTLKSIVDRGHMPAWLAKSNYKRGINQISKIENAIIVNYEDLVDDPVSVMKTLCGKLNLDYDSRVIDAAKYNRRYKSSVNIK